MNASVAGIGPVAGRVVSLCDLLRQVPGARVASGRELSVPVLGITQDSRRALPGYIFVARRGKAHDGTAFLADARANGAMAVVLDENDDGDAGGLIEIRVPSVSHAIALLSHAFYGHPTSLLSVVGITGTNGKTTTAHLVQACIDACGGRAGIVGTVGYEFEDFKLAATHTSPEADELARIARVMLDRGATHLVMEASSIALQAGRVDGVRFRVAAFTNLTQDHLDYHGSMEDYASAKERLFTECAPGAAVVNVGDEFGGKLAERIAPRFSAETLVRFSMRNVDADVRATHFEQTRNGFVLEASIRGKGVSIRSPLVGTHNAENILTALSVAVALGLDPEEGASALSGPIFVPGRLERCDDPVRDDVLVLVDYAHTDDALRRALESVRPLSEGRILCVFGCGGDRDAAKRPLMGRAAGDLADWICVTNDNPRSEDPLQIAEAIVAGLKGRRADFVVELDREKAIRLALQTAEPGDVLLIAGKGHETYQIIGATTRGFDDREVARAALLERRKARGTRGGA